MLSVPSHRFLPVGVLTVAILSSSIFVMLPAVISNQQSQTAYATFPGENGKIAFISNRDGNYEIYVMNSDGSEQTRLTNNPTIDTTPDWSPYGETIVFRRGLESQNPEIYIMNADGSEQTNISNNPAIDFDPSWSPDGTKIAFMSTRDGGQEIYVMNAADGSEQTNISNIPRSDGQPDWGPATEPPEDDTTPPVLTVPDDMVVEATSEQGTEVTYNVTAEDNVDGTATLEEDGTTITQDDVGGNITITCEPPSGSEFPVGDTEVQCTATDEAGNVGGPETFTITVNPPPPPGPTTPTELIEKLISDIENLEGFPEGAKTRIVALLERALALLSDDNTRNDASACNMIGTAFMNQVNANERQDTLTEDQATDLRTQAEDIRDTLGC
jgi:hypothetical protein